MTKKYKTSLLVGGVNSPVRAGISVNADRFIASKAQGPFLFDQSGTPFLDYICGFGPILLGHQHPSIQATIADTKAFSALGVCNEFEEPLAHLIQKANPTIEKVRMTNSGGEAVNAAIRIAKAATKRTQIIKFSGQYHGAVESVLGYVMPSQSIDTGIDPNVSEQLSCLTFNDIAQLESAFKVAPPAAVIIEVISASQRPCRTSLPTSPTRPSPRSCADIGVNAMLRPDISIRTGQSTLPPRATPARSTEA